MSITILDIETISKPEEEILKSLPEWSEEEARSRMPKNYSKKETQDGWLETDKANHGKDAIEKAALNPETATIAIVGFWKEGRVEQLVLSDMDDRTIYEVENKTYVFTEPELIEHAFLRLTESGRYSGGILLPTEFKPVLGWNLIGFDLKMLIRRAWILGVKVPSTIFNPLSRYPIPERFVDMMDRYRAGSFKDPYTGLNAALKAMGLPEKGDGKEFGKLWQEDRAKALEYSRNELDIQAQLYRKMGVKL